MQTDEHNNNIGDGKNMDFKLGYGTLGLIALLLTAGGPCRNRVYPAAGA